MKTKLLYTALFLLPVTFFSCQMDQKNRKNSFCNKTMNYKVFENNMTVAFSHMNADHSLDKKYGCPPMGQAIFPSIEFSGVPKQATHLYIEIVDATCSYGCDSCCQFKHCVLEFPLTALKNKEIFNFNGIKELDNPNEQLNKYLLKNGAGKREFFPFCPPPFQTHAFYIRMTALKLDQNARKTILAKTQSTPALLWSEKEATMHKRELKTNIKQTGPNTKSNQSHALSATLDSSPSSSPTPSTPTTPTTAPSSSPSAPTPPPAESAATPSKPLTDKSNEKNKTTSPSSKSGSVNPNTPAPKDAHFVKPLKSDPKSKKSTPTTKDDIVEPEKPLTFEQNSWK